MLYFQKILMVAFTIFWFSIYRYGIFYALAFLIGYFGLMQIGKLNLFPQNSKINYFLSEWLEDIIAFIALGVILWWRLGHVIIYGEGYYFNHPTEIFQVRKWGMSFIGGIIGVVSTLWIYLWKQKCTRKDFLMLFDLILIFVPVWIFFGRFGNFLNQELYGIPISELSSSFAQLLSSLHLTHTYTQIDQIIRVNTNFLSMLLEGLSIFIIQISIFLIQKKKKTRKTWFLATNFLILYSLIRFGLEYLRADSQLEIINGLSKSQWIFLLFIIIGISIKYFLNKQKTLDLN